MKYTVLVIVIASALITGCRSSSDANKDSDVYGKPIIAEQKFDNGDSFHGRVICKREHGATKEGPGKYTWVNGDVYKGDFENDKMHGQGRLTYANGNVYYGNFKNGLMHGQGLYQFADGTRYEGSLEKGVMSGTGRLTFPNGSFYKGEFKNDKMHGKGVLTKADGSKVSGKFRDNLLIE